MPTSIFTVEVDDRAFQKFKELFDEYQEALEKSPKGWKDINKELDGARKRIEKINDGVNKTEGSVADLVQRTATWQRMAGATHSVMGGIEHRVASIARYAKDILFSFTKLSAWTGLGAGLLGVGSLWGLERVAMQASNIRRTTQGLGMREGEVQAYQTNFQRFFDPRSVLNNIASAKNDPSRQWAFATMGLDRERSTADLATEMPLRAKQIFAEGGQNQQYAQARGLLEIYTMEDLRRLHEMSEQEIRDAQKRFAMDQRQFKVSDETAKKWQYLSVQLERSGTAIETSFIRALSPLAPELEKLSDAFTTAVTDIFTTDRLREVITLVAGGIEDAGKYLASDKFKQDLRDFGTSVEQLWNALKRVARWISGWFDSTPGGDGQRAGLMDPRGEQQDGRRTVADDYEAEEERKRRELRWSFPYRRTGDAAGRLPGQEGFDPVSASERQHGLPENLLQNIWTVESGRGQSMLGPVTRTGERAEGHFQFMPRTGAQYGLIKDERTGRNDFRDLEKSSVAAGRYMRDLTEWFKGDLRAATAAYNWGPGNVQGAMAARGDKWEELLPPETRNYLEKIFGARAPVRVNVRLDNQTGASPVISQNVAVAQ